MTKQTRKSGVLKSNSSFLSPVLITVQDREGGSTLFRNLGPFHHFLPPFFTEEASFSWPRAAVGDGPTAHPHSRPWASGKGTA